MGVYLDRQSCWQAVKPVQPDKGKIQVQNTFFKSVLDPLPLADQYF
jgi:hypothetical protein